MIRQASTRQGQVRQAYIDFRGGLDTVTSPLRLKPGVCREAINVEQLPDGGYVTTDGYEAFNGKPAPSSASFAIIDYVVIESFAVGDVVTGATSGASGVVIALNTGELVLTKVVGAFVSGEALQVSAVTKGTSLSTLHGAQSELLSAQYTHLAAGNYRADIAAVPGSGSVLGVLRMGGVTYAWRNNSGGTAAAIYKSSASGWVLVPLFYELGFTAGSGAAPAEGSTITKTPASAVLKRIVLTSGKWSDGNAAGKFIIAAPSGGSFSSGAFSGGVTATCSGAEAVIVIPAGGRYTFHIANFTGAVSTLRAYGANGVGRGFEFDGTVFAPISTGMANDAPKHVRQHANHLFFTFGASLQHSAAGLPYQWSPVVGAGELAMGDEITGLYPQAGSESGGALIVFTRNRRSVLYGTGVSNWKLVALQEEAGALPYTIQDVGFLLLLDDRGFSSLAATQAFGNFSSGTLSDRILNVVIGLLPFVAGSCISRDKSQYRLFTSTGEAIYISLSKGVVTGFMLAKHKHSFTCVFSAEEGNAETILAGSTDGFVYQLDRGTSFNGLPIAWSMELPPNNMGSPRIEKQFYAMMIEVSCSGHASFNVGSSLGYGQSTVMQPSADVIQLFSGAAKYDSGLRYDSGLKYDKRDLAPVVIQMTGQAENVALRFSGESAYYRPIKFTAAIINYAQRKIMS